MEDRLVSVIMPAYRADRHIRAALESIVRQTHANWELVVVEDGSLGTTQQTVGDFARHAAGHRVAYLHHDTNQGAGAARNTALAEAGGEFLAFLDADDVWQEGHLEASIAMLIGQEADVAFSTALMFEDGTEHLVGLWGPTRERLLAVRPPLRTFPNWLLHRNFIIPSATVLRRRVVEIVGGFSNDPRVVVSEDLDYWLRCVAAGLRFVHVPGCHCLYRKGCGDAATVNMPMILRHQAFVLKKHLGLSAVPKRIRRRQAAYFHTAAAVFNLDVDIRAAADLFLEAWRIRPERIDLLLLAGWSRFVLPFLPNLGLVRRFKRAHGY
jgi:glycosyltransferase involved in cell wall biosynthesis